jgi:hypothetical protein
MVGDVATVRAAEGDSDTAGDAATLAAVESDESADGAEVADDDDEEPWLHAQSTRLKHAPEIKIVRFMIANYDADGTVACHFPLNLACGMLQCAVLLVDFIVRNNDGGNRENDQSVADDRRGHAVRYDDLNDAPHGKGSQPER